MAERSPAVDRRRQRGATVLILVAVVAGMTGLTFASVPLYRIFCGATGFGGTTQRAAAAPDEISRALVTVSFDAQTAPGLDWEFRPLTPSVTVHPGAQTQVFFRAVNRSRGAGHRARGLQRDADKIGIYFDKLQCFCFSNQTLAPGQKHRYGGRVLCRPRHAEGPRHARSALDHPVLHDVSCSRISRACRAQRRSRADPIAGATLRELTDRGPSR